MNRLSFDLFQVLNARRCNLVFHSVESWPPEIWALAIAGEAGELCNLLKKVIRGDFLLDEEVRQMVLSEVADIITYCDLLMTRLQANTADELLKKFNEISKRRGFPQVE